MKISVTLPLTDNNGASLAIEHGIIKAELMAVTHGFSVIRNVEGFWQDEETGIIYNDLSDVVYTLTDTEKAAYIRDVLAPKWAVMLHQVCLLVEVASTSATFAAPVKAAA